MNSTKETESLYKPMNGHAPEYLQRLFTQYYSNYNLRNSEGNLDLDLLINLSETGRRYPAYRIPTRTVRQSCKAVVNSVSF